MRNSLRSLRRPGRPRRSPRALLLLTLPVLVLTGCEQRFGMPAPVTTEGHDVLDLWLLCMYVAIALGALVLGILFYSLIRHRRRNDDLPHQNEGNTALEITYTIIPFILCGVLFAYGLKAQVTQTALSEDPGVRITATGFQWNWRFEYPSEGVTITGGADGSGMQSGSDTMDSPTLPEIQIPVDETIRFNVVAADVAHSFYVPGFLTKRDLIPGIRNEIEVTPEKEGTYVGHCAEYCGLNHSQMNFRVKVVSEEAYQAWLETKKGASESR